MTLRRATGLLLSAALAVPALAACGTDDAVEPTGASAGKKSSGPREPKAGQSASATPAGDPTGDGQTDGADDGQTDGPDDGPPFPDATESQTAEPQGEWDLVLADVRVGDHDGYDRVVLEFSGTGVPGWSVGYVDEGVLDGSGEPVPLEGDTVLDVYASGTTYPAEDGQSYPGPQRFQPENGGDVAEVYVGGTFEGDTQVLVGLDGEAAPFRVFALSDPARLVVDVVD